MPKIAKELTAIEVQRLKAPGFVSIGGVAGLSLQITPNGARSWVLRVARAGAVTQSGRPKRLDIGLGAYPGVSLAQARQKAAELRRQIAEGRDPLEERQSALARAKAERAASMTFSEAAERFIQVKAPEWSNPKSAAQWRSTLKTYAYPVIGALDIKQVNQAHVERILMPIWATKTETATRVRGRIEGVLNWAIAGGYRTGDNPARWRGLLDKRLGNPTKLKDVEHHPAVSIDELHDFLMGLRQRQGYAARALELAMLTATRSGEVRGALWSEFDLDAAVWTIPAHRMKMRKEHRVPLSVPAIALLTGLPRVEGTELVFPSRRGTTLSDAALSAVMKRMGRREVPHGLRSSFRDWCAENTNFPRDLCEMALAHTITNKAEAAYRRGDMLERRRALMDAWTKFVQSPPAADAEVVPMLRGAT